MGYIPYQQPISKSVNLDIRVNRQLESRMREIRQSGSEGGGAQTNAFSLPLSKLRRFGRLIPRIGISKF